MRFTQDWRVQVFRPGLLCRVVRVRGGLPGLSALKADAFMEHCAQPLVADVLDYTSATRNSASLDRLRAETAGHGRLASTWRSS